MAQFTFYKYQGTGNDFILVDHREGGFPKENKALIAKWCDRRFGIGADGLILLEEDEALDFKMVYYNADGSESTMCGNGGRCIVAFARDLGMVQEQCEFSAIDGHHEASIAGEIVTLKMIDVKEIQTLENACVVNTGSPHYVTYVEKLEEYPVFEKGRQIRNSDRFKTQGINVNFVQVLGSDSLFVRTYERGVEDETYSCGTGVTAAALTYLQDQDLEKVNIKVKGGKLVVKAQKNGTEFSNIWLEGPALRVFKTEIQL